MNSFTTDAIGKGCVVPVGDDLAGVAVQHDGLDVGPGLGRVGGGLTDAGVESVERRRRLGGWGFGQRGSEACGATTVARGVFSRPAAHPRPVPHSR